MGARAFDFVEAREVSKIYGRHRALSGVSLRLEPGRVVGLLGPNGSGKTTLLTIFSTLSRPTSGAVHFGAIPKAELARGHIGLVSHAPLSYGDLTALENVLFYARLYRVANAEAEARSLLARFGLADAMDRPARTFSRGMLQRLGLARALIGRPSLVLLDEPFTGLDAASTEHVMEEVRRLRAAEAMVLMISHDHAITAALVDEAAILNRGRLAAHHVGALDVEALRARYAEATERAS